MLFKSKLYSLIFMLFAFYLSACSATPVTDTPQARTYHPAPAPVPRTHRVSTKKRVIPRSVKRAKPRRSVKPRLPVRRSYTRKKPPARRKQIPVIARPAPVSTVATTRRRERAVQAQRPAQPIVVTIPSRKKVIVENASNPYETVPRRRSTTKVAPITGVSPVIQGLLAEAQGAASQQRYSSAISYLERALRIEPKNPIIWTELAKTHYDKGSDARAIAMAKKSNLYSASGSALERKNWSIIKMASKRSGNIQSLKDALHYERIRS